MTVSLQLENKNLVVLAFMLAERCYASRLWTRSSLAFFLLRFLKTTRDCGVSRAAATNSWSRYARLANLQKWKNHARGVETSEPFYLFHYGLSASSIFLFKFCILRYICLTYFFFRRHSFFSFTSCSDLNISHFDLYHPLHSSTALRFFFILFSFFFSQYFNRSRFPFLSTTIFSSFT